jgi:hypothetical protein
MEAEMQQEFVGALFVPPQVREQAFSNLSRTIIVRMGPFRGVDRGQLLQRLKESLAASLRRRDLSVSDLAGVTRASTLLYAAAAASEGYGRLVVTFESLAPIANASGALDGEDSRVLRDLLLAAETCDVTVVFDPDDAGIDVFGAPTPLASLLPPPVSILEFPENAFENAAVYAVSPGGSTHGNNYAVSPGGSTHGNQADTPSDNVDLDEEALTAATVVSEEAEVEAIVFASPATEREPSAMTPAPRQVICFDDEGPAEGSSNPIEDIRLAYIPSEPATLTATPYCHPEAKPKDPPCSNSVLKSGDPSGQEPFRMTESTALDRPKLSVGPQSKQPLRKTAAGEAARRNGSIDGSIDDWRTYVSALEALRGPQPMSTLERLFTTAYMPLGAMIESGLREPRAQKALHTFGSNFANVYRDASAMMGHRQKLPRMVMDAADLAAKEAKEVGARHVVLLWCDALRFDIGMHLRNELEVRASDIATLVGETLLWAALPSTTPRQAETFVRGREALQSPNEPESETAVLRERTADIVRKVRMGSRELYKLDLIESRLRNDHLDMSTIASEVAISIEKFARAERAKRSQRTLLFVFGDHGFAFDRNAFREGGAQPEQVLVPALSWVLDSAS